MKQTKSVLALCLIAVLVLALLGGCVPEIDDIELEEDEIVLSVGEKYDVEYELYPKDAEGELEWESDDEDVAKVNSRGRITAKGTGECTITVYSDSGAEAEIDVIVRVPVESIYLSNYSVKLRPGESFHVTAEVYPDEAQCELEWKSSDKSVATVDDGYISAEGEGSCTITVSAPNGVSEEVDVSVNNSSYEDNLLIGVYSLDFTYVENYTSDPDDATLYIYEDGTGELYYYGRLYRSFTWRFDYSDSRGYYYVAYTDDGLVEEIFVYGEDSDYAGDVNYHVYDGETFYFNG